MSLVIIAKCFVFMKKNVGNTKARCSRRNCAPRVVRTLPPDEAAAVAGLPIYECDFCS